MGRAPCCDKANVKKGPWSPEEDAKLKDFIDKHGTGGNWIALPHKAGLKRCGKSCRLRWLNYLRPNIKHGEFTEDEDRIISSLYANIGSRWSIIAGQLPGRTDNDIKNYWNTKLRKKLLSMLPSFQKKPSYFPSMPLQSQPDHLILNNFLNASSSLYNYNPNPNPYFMNTSTTMNSLLTTTASHLVHNHINDSHLFSPPPPPQPKSSANASTDMVSNINYCLGFQDQNMNKECYYPEVKEKMLMFGGEMNTTYSSSEGGGSSMSPISYNKDLHRIKQEDQFALGQGFGDQIHGYMTDQTYNYVDQKPKGYFKNLIDINRNNNVNINSYLMNGDDENKTTHIISDGCYDLMIDGSN